MLEAGKRKSTNHWTLLGRMCMLTTGLVKSTATVLFLADTSLQHPRRKAPGPYQPIPRDTKAYHAQTHIIVQELCESRGGRPGLSVLTSLLVFVDVKLY